LPSKNPREVGTPMTIGSAARTKLPGKAIRRVRKTNKDKKRLFFITNLLFYVKDFRLQPKLIIKTFLLSQLNQKNLFILC